MRRREPEAACATGWAAERRAGAVLRMRWWWGSWTWRLLGGGDPFRVSRRRYEAGAVEHQPVRPRFIVGSAPARRGVQTARSGRGRDVLRLQALGTARDLELDALALVEAAVAGAGDRRVVGEEVVAAF